MLAIVARAAAVLVLQSHTVPRSTFEHGEIAANLLAGRGFSVRFLHVDGPTSQQAPLYPVIVAGAYWIGGVGTPRSLLILELGQALLGGLMVAGTMALAREVAPRRPWAARAAGLIVAAHPSLVYAATHVQVASLAICTLVWTLALAYRSARDRRPATALGTGVLLGLTILTDPILGLVAPGVAWVMARAGGGRRFLAVAVAAMLTVAPWIARNYQVHGELVLVKSSFGYAFWQGNCALSEGTDKVVRPSVERILASGTGADGMKGWNEALWKARHEAGYIDDIALTADDYRELVAVSEPERSRILFRRALADLRAEPLRYPALCLRRLRYFVFWDETNPKTRSLVYRAGHLGLTILAAWGWLAMGPALRRAVAPTALTVALVAAFHAATIVSARFHLPIEPLMALWAGCGTVALTGGKTLHRLVPHFSRNSRRVPLDPHVT